MKRILSLALCLLMVLSLCVSLSGCGNKKASVYILNFKPESAKAYEKIAKAYEEETGIAVKVVTAAANTYEQTLKSEVAKNDAPTIFQVNGPIGFQSWKEYCADLTDTKLYSYLSDKDLAIKDNGRVYAIPYVVEGYGIIYNDAIMQKYFTLADKKTNVKTVAEINNFETLKSVVEDMTANKEKLGISGVFASTSLAGGEDWRWQSHLANIPIYHEFYEKDNSADPTLAAVSAEEIAFKYADNFKNIFDLYINNSVTAKTLLGSKSVNDSMAEFALGKCAMVQNGTWAWSQIKDVNGNTVKEEDIGMLPIYMGVEGEEKIGICVGTENYLAINKKVSEDKQQKSIEFLNWLYSSETGKQFVKNELGFATPFNTFSEAEQPDDPLAKEMSRYIKNGETKTIPWVFAGFPSENFKTTFGDALLLYAQGTKTFDEVKEIVKNKWQSERK
ncbi:MAG: ABC transporter substrate-binding protein [Acutalibacteraceae bacterium]|nr:ABC transporter substrate-binding protein [Acutalibacteraceae bacterium]